jgi:formylglycine-generating enzyme required for sulfatase activity
MTFTRSTASLALAFVIAPVWAKAAEPGMAQIPGREFQRGRTFPWVDAELKYSPTALTDDLPVRAIRVSTFLLDEAEVTNEQYAAFIATGKHRAPYHWVKGQMPADRAKHPVVNVSWDDASAYCAAAGKRLPTEAEWEHACRGGADKAMFPWGSTDPEPKLAHFNAAATTEVCTKPRNPFGLCDMAGNVWEWTADWYDRTYYAVAPAVNPPGQGHGMYRVLRGGSWFDQGKLFLTCSYRSWARPPERSPTIGFRCAKDITNAPR